MTDPVATPHDCKPPERHVPVCLDVLTRQKAWQTAHPIQMHAAAEFVAAIAEPTSEQQEKPTPKSQKNLA